ncbi:MAG: cell division protein ZapA [bacterium]
MSIRIMDAEYAITGYEDSEYLQEVAQLVDRRMKLLRQIYSDISLHKAAILTALNLADELLRTRNKLEQCQEEAAQFSKEIADRSSRLVQKCRQIKV